MSFTRWAGIRLAASAMAACGVVFMSNAADAQTIRNPGDHPDYVVELEPHLVWQVGETEDLDDSGFGVGLRASIPLMKNGPVPSINNNMAIGFGFDWAHIGNDCGGNWRVAGFAERADCHANHFFVPVVLQWNFFFTPVVGAFTELGLALHHSSEEISCNGVVQCDAAFSLSRSDTDAIPVFAVGGRFILADPFALTVRLGYPYFLVGASFLL